MIDLRDIFNSWVKSFNPTPDELSRAEERFSICSTCEFRKEVVNTLVCGACGCPISKKVYSSAVDPCPKDKWVDVDKKYGNILPRKKHNSLL